MKFKTLLNIFSLPKSAATDHFEKCPSQGQTLCRCLLRYPEEFPLTKVHNRLMTMKGIIESDVICLNAMVK